MVIDVHAHVFEAPNAGRIMADMGARSGIPSYSDGTVGGLMEAMDAAGVTVAAVSRIAVRPDSVGRVNDWLWGLRGPRVVPVATLHPDVPRLGEYVEGLRARGFRGIKLHPDHQGFFADERRAFPLYAAARDAGLWVLLHAGLDRGLPGKPVHVTPRGLLRLHREFPGLTIIAAHLGGEDVYEETEDLLAGRDLYLDTSFVLRKVAPAVLERLVNRHSTERLLFGSDSPWGHPGDDLSYLRTLNYLDGRALDRIVCRNAAELLGLAV